MTPEPDARTPRKIDTRSIIDARRFDFGGLVVTESVDSDGALVFWALSDDPTAPGVYDYPEHEDPTVPIRRTAVGHRLERFTPETPGRCNAIRYDGGHCRLPLGRCRFHSTESTLF